MTDLIRNTDLVPPGTFVRSHRRGKVVFEVLETELRGRYLMGRLRDLRSARSWGWKYLDTMTIVAPEEAREASAAPRSTFTAAELAAHDAEVSAVALETADFRFTDEQWRQYQAMPDQGYSHRRQLEAFVAHGLRARAAELREALRTSAPGLAPTLDE